jgi:hypothetical protein
VDVFERAVAPQHQGQAYRGAPGQPVSIEVRVDAVHGTDAVVEFGDGEQPRCRAGRGLVLPVACLQIGHGCRRSGSAAALCR